LSQGREENPAFRSSGRKKKFKHYGNKGTQASEIRQRPCPKSVQ